MRLEGVEEGGDAGYERVVDNALILQGGDLQAAMLALLVDLGLFGADEGALVDVRVDLNVGVIAQLQGVLEVELLALLTVLWWKALNINLPTCCSQQAFQW